MKLWFKVLCNNTRELNTTIAFMVGQEAAFLLNLCEGWQHTTKLRISEIYNTDHIFVHSLSHASLGGVPGLYRLLAAVHRKEDYKLNVYGPPQLPKYLSSFRCVDDKESAKFLAKDFRNGVLAETAIKVNGVNVYPLWMGGAGDEAGSELSYLVQPERRWTGMNEEIVERFNLGVTELNTLSSGSQITLPNGSVLQPKEVYGKYESSPAALFLFPSNSDYLGSLANNPVLRSYMNPTADKKIGIVYHSVCSTILFNPEYLNFLSKFGRHAVHVLDCKEINISCPTRRKAEGFNKLLYTCNNKLFPEKLLGKIPGYPDANRRMEILTRFCKQGLDVKLSGPGNGYHLYPSITHSTVKEGLYLGKMKDQISRATNYILNNPELCEVKKAYEEYKNTKKYKNEPSFIMLGTVAPSFTDLRILASIYMSVPLNGESYSSPQKAGILIDCGEGTYGQLLDHCKDTHELREKLLSLKVIFVSHFHGDHSAGAITVLKERDKLLDPKAANDPIYVVAPNRTIRNITAGLDVNGIRNKERIKLIPGIKLNPDSIIHYNPPWYLHKIPPVALTEAQIETMLENLYKSQDDENAKKLWTYLKRAAGINRFYTFEVDHVTDSHGLIIQGPDWKIAYSGDTAPCVALENFAKGSDLLIHECTLTETFDKPTKTKHTNLVQAKRIMENVKPWRMILTHFAKKTKKVSEFPEELADAGMFPAMDHLQFSLSDAEWLPNTVPIFKRAFKKAGDCLSNI